MTNLLYTGANSNRTHSPAVWAKCPMEALNGAGYDGHYFFDDFEALPTYTEADDVVAEGPYPYMAAASDGVTLNKAADTDFGAAHVAGTDADEDGLVLVYGNAAGWARFGPTDRVWFEARHSQSSIADSNAVFFLGFVEVNVPPTSVITLVDATGVLDLSEDFVGWRSLAADGNAAEAIYQEGAATLAQLGLGSTNAQGSGNDVAIAAATFYKYGFKWDGPRMRLSYYVDGVKQAYYTVKSTDAFPDVNHLAMCWAVKTTAAAEISFDMDWWSGGYESLT